MHSLSTLHKYTCLKRFTLCNETSKIVFIFYDAAMASAYASLAKYESLSNKEVVIKTDNFSLKELWRTELASRCIAKYNKKAMAKLLAG